MKKVVVAAGFKVKRVCVEAGSMVIQECLEGPNIKSEAGVGLAESGGVQGERLVVAGAGIKLEDKRSTVSFVKRQTLG